MQRLDLLDNELKTIWLLSRMINEDDKEVTIEKLKIITETMPLIEIDYEAFFREGMLDYLNELNSEENIKYRTAVDKQRGYNITLVPSSQMEIEEEVYDELEALLIIYDTPPFNLSIEEYHILCKSIYELFANKNATDKYYEVLRFLGRCVIASSLIYDLEEINLDSFIDWFFAFTGYGFSNEELNETVEKIRKKVTHSKIINISDIKRNLTKKNLID